MQIVGATGQGKGRNEADQSKNMVSVKMGNKDVINFRKTDLEFSHLGLSPFPAIDQKKPPKYIEYLSGWIST